MDAKQDNNRRWTQMDADKGTAGKLGRADVRSRRSRRSRRFLGLLTSGFIAWSALASVQQ
jgi:hypothetical protein